ncbi:MAG TPA: alpha/beta fold hydrolase [Polyangiales bacterium]|nr:alpha/beta fold hydrolase [Polyangiales bacterium]
MQLIQSTSSTTLTERQTDQLTWLDRRVYPFTSKYFATPEGRMHYIDEGHGRPILFVHGTPSWSFEWRHALSALRQERRTIAVDHLGFGLSDKPRDAGYRPEDHARRLLEFVRALDLRELTLVVHDFGGPIGLPIMLEEPERVRSLVILNSWAWPHANDPRVRRLSRVIASWFGRWLYLWLNASPRWLVPAAFARRSALTPHVHRHYLAPFSRRADRTAPWVLGVELAASDAHYASLWQRRALLQRVPSTLIWGQRDPAFGAAYLERWREVLPDARVRTLADVGHFPQEEAPEAVLAALREALED